jgi:hypothetical protein
MRIAVPKVYVNLPFESNKKLDAGLTLLTDLIFSIIGEKQGKMKDGESGKIYYKKTTTTNKQTNKQTKKTNKHLTVAQFFQCKRLEPPQGLGFSICMTAPYLVHSMAITGFMGEEFLNCFYSETCE